jgi:hypothetical protein
MGSAPPQSIQPPENRTKGPFFALLVFSPITYLFLVEFGKRILRLA